MADKKYLTATQVAKYCKVDLKTVHNWVNRGDIVFFRTPGRHLRFEPVDVISFLEKFGFPVPVELQNREFEVDKSIDFNKLHWVLFRLVRYFDIVNILPDELLMHIRMKDNFKSYGVNEQFTGLVNMRNETVLLEVKVPQSSIGSGSNDYFYQTSMRLTFDGIHNGIGDLTQEAIKEMHSELKEEYLRGGNQ